MAGRGTNAANLAKDAAEKAEEDFDYDLASKLFEQAAQAYEMDNQQNLANTQWVKWADLKILSLGESNAEFARIIKTFEKVGFKALTSGLSKGMAKDYFFKAGLCYLANQDLVGCRAAMMNYTCEDPSWEQDRKCKLILRLAEACDQRERDAFGRAVADF